MIRRRIIAPHALPLGIYAILTVAMTWPIAIHPASLVPHDLGDPLLSTWVLWWNAHVLPFSEKWWNGPFFFPSSSTLTFSDHRVGLGIISTPAILLGASPLAAQNAVFLLTFFLSAAAAYALCFSLTRSREASFIGGLVFGFNPYRADHLSHLELLASYWLPVTLLSLHRWSATRKPTWLVAASASLLMQAVTCGYYFFFFGVLLLLWLVWFVPRSLSIKQLLALGLALAAPLIVIAPILLRYRQAHTSLGLSRSIGDIEFFSADVIGLATAPDLLALWNSPPEWMRPEGAIFPGVTAVLLVIAALLWREREVAGQLSRVHIARRMLIILSATAAVVALIPPLIGPVGFDIAGVRVSTSSSYKPLSVAFLLAICWLLTSPWVRHAWRAQTPLAFYTLATITMWLFALGPTARFLGERVLYKAPYAWLMVLPGFRDEFRVPSRFAMLAVLTLAIAAAVAFQKLFASRATQTKVATACVLALAVVAESWIEPFPVVQAPAALTIPAAVPADAVIAELPTGVFEDAIAMYHSMLHQRPIVNGLSGYDAAHYQIVRAGLREGSVQVLSPIARHASVAIFVRRDDESGLVSQLTRGTAAQSIGLTPSHEVLLLPRLPKVQSATGMEGRPLPIRGLTSPIHANDLPRMVDGSLGSLWSTNAPQQGSESFTADLEAVFDVTSVILEGAIVGFPRSIAIELSSDGATWNEAWRGPTTERSVAAAIENPRVVPLTLGFPTQPARHVRVSQTGQSRDMWSVGELRILGSARQSTQ